MKAERCGKLLDDIIWDESLLAQIPRALFEAFILYLSNADIDNQSLERNLSSIKAPDLRNTAMTLAQKLRQEGRQEGRSSALQDSIIDALDLRHRSVPAGLVEVIRQISEEERLHALFRHAIRCDSIEDFTRNL